MPRWARCQGQLSSGGVLGKSVKCCSGARAALSCCLLHMGCAICKFLEKREQHTSAACPKTGQSVPENLYRSVASQGILFRATVFTYKRHLSMHVLAASTSLDDARALHP